MTHRMLGLKLDMVGIVMGGLGARKVILDGLPVDSLLKVHALVYKLGSILGVARNLLDKLAILK